MGEMGLEPRVFWRLTPREFWIKYRAFVRAENRLESLYIRQALRTGGGKPQVRAQLAKEENRLRQYPVKPWIKG